MEEVRRALGPAVRPERALGRGLVVASAPALPWPGRPLLVRVRRADRERGRGGEGPRTDDDDDGVDDDGAREAARQRTGPAAPQVARQAAPPALSAYLRELTAREAQRWDLAGFRHGQARGQARGSEAGPRPGGGGLPPACREHAFAGKPTAEELDGILRAPVESSWEGHVLRPFATLRVADLAFDLFDHPEFSLHGLLRFSPALFADDARARQTVLQVLAGLDGFHRAGEAHGELAPRNIFVAPSGAVALGPPSGDDLGPGPAAEGPPPAADAFPDLAALVRAWRDGALSNFDYLLELNRVVGRNSGDPKFYPMMPWVVDMTVRPDPADPASEAGWRDLGKTKFRLAKGDEQLDFTYRTSSPPHHVANDMVSELAVCMYLARRLPEAVLTAVVRPVFEPGEYPPSVRRLYEWTPDEAIPEFYADPSTFASRHAGMRDLEVPTWCASAADFVAQHRACLESPRVSARLHLWIDLNFGHQLSGPAAVAAKNLRLPCAPGVLRASGCFQVFARPHPRRYARYKEIGGVGAPEPNLAALEADLSAAVSWTPACRVLAQAVRERGDERSPASDLRDAGKVFLALQLRTPQALHLADRRASDLEARALVGGGAFAALEGFSWLAAACLGGDRHAVDCAAVLASDAFSEADFVASEIQLACEARGPLGARLRAVARCLARRDVPPAARRPAEAAVAGVLQEVLDAAVVAELAEEEAAALGAALDACLARLWTRGSRGSLRDFVCAALARRLRSARVPAAVLAPRRWARLRRLLGADAFFQAVLPKLLDCVTAAEPRLARLATRGVVRGCRGLPYPVLVRELVEPVLFRLIHGDRLCAVLQGLLAAAETRALQAKVVAELQQLMFMPANMHLTYSNLVGAAPVLKARAPSILEALAAVQASLPHLDDGILRRHVAEIPSAGDSAGDEAETYGTLLTLIMVPFPDLRVVCRAIRLLVEATHRVGGAAALLRGVVPLMVRPLLDIRPRAMEEKRFYDQILDDDPDGGPAGGGVPGHKRVMAAVHGSLARVMAAPLLRQHVPQWDAVGEYIRGAALAGSESDGSGDSDGSGSPEAADDGSGEEAGEAGKISETGWEWFPGIASIIRYDAAGFIIPPAAHSSAAQGSVWALQARTVHSWRAHARLHAMAVDQDQGVLLTAGCDSDKAGDVVRVWDWASCATR